MKAPEVAAKLSQRMEAIAVTLTGKPPSSRTQTELRFGTRGSLSVEIAGAKRGQWFDHSAGAGGDALDLVRHLRGGTMADALKWARDWLGNPDPARGTRQRAQTVQPQKAADDDSLNVERARQIWLESVPAAGTLVERYLASRGLVPPRSGVLRFHPRCLSGADRLPAMVALMTDAATNQPQGVHRTFLAPDGGSKAAVENPKMMLGRAGVIRLRADEDVHSGLGIAEGIETALSIIQIAEWAAVWACCSAGAIARFPVLAGIEVLTIFADADQAGMKAAQACGERWAAAAREVHIIRPRAGGDWNDVTRQVAA